MAIAYKAGNGQQGASVTPTWPAVAAGDVAILAHAISSTYAAPSTPSGFTLLTSVVGVSSDISVRLTVWYKTCTGSESGNVVTFDNAGSSYEVASISLYSGVGELGSQGTAVTTVAATTLDSATVADVVAGHRVVHVVAGEDTTPNTVISTSGATTRQSLTSATELASMLVAEKSDSGAAVTFNQTITASLAIISVALRGASVAGGLLAGIVPPGIDDGVTNDYYVDTAHAVLYGPKDSDLYGSAINALSGTPAEEGTDSQDMTRGMRFRAVVDGRLTGMRFYRSSSSAVTSRNFYLWSDAGAQLATVASSGESGAGWKSVTLASPYSLVAGTYYRIAYAKPITETAWITWSDPVTSAPAYIDNLDDRYGWTTLTGFPDGTDGAANFWIDVIFEPQSDTLWPVALRGVVPGTTAPSSPSVGDVWVDTN